MGLDIYLKKYNNFEDSKKREDEYEKESSKNWEFNGRDYKELSESEKELARNKDEQVAKRLNLDDCGTCNNVEKIELNHPKYPDHYFKIGYFRSSYNDSGIERVLGNLNVGGLYFIFDDPKEYEFQPDWNNALKNVNESILELKNVIDSGNAYKCIKVSYNEFSGHPNNYPVDSEEKALQEFMEVKSNKDHTGSFSNKVGEFFLDNPLNVSSIILGVNKRFFTDEKLPCSYVIYKDDEMDWYLQALEIIKSTIEFVLDQKDADKYYLVWSS